MRTIQATELKAKLSAILGDVERGEEIGISRHGKTIAMIVPPRLHDRERVAAAIEKLKAFRKTLPPTGITIQDILDARHQDHKY